ncbi:MAG: DUF1553 domain-containing protein, partial [Planctomycetaceae bacterium]|nr:DUF1553 domain-containing protein [Planctomycetaceae bacterium]
NNYSGTGFIDDGRRQITEWLYESLLTNKPYDQFVRELITPEPRAAGFIRGIKWRGDVNTSQATEIQFAQSVGQVLLGINMKCASCHDSFIDRWTLDETYNFAAIYATGPLEVHRCDVPAGRFAQPAWLFPELGAVDPSADQPERLRQLAELMTHPDNGRLTRTIVNRIWQRMMGRGIVHPVDAMQTRPWSEDLLDFLAGDFVEHGYDLKHTIELIASSQAYQSEVAAIECPLAADEYLFTGPLARRMTAEQFVDAIHSLGRTWPGPDGGAYRLDGRGQGGQLAAVMRAEERAASRIPLEELVNEQLVRSILNQSVWIWSDAEFSAVAPQTVRHFRVVQNWDNAAHVLALCAADNAATVFINGRQLASQQGFDRMLVMEATHRRQPGVTTIAVRVENEGQEPNPAAFLLSFAGLSEQGELLWVQPASDTWRTSEESPGGWEQPGFADDAWPEAVVIGNAGDEPWKLLDNFNGKKFALQRDWDSLWGSRPVRASLGLQDRLQATLGRPNREQIVTERPSQLTTLEAISLSNGEDLARMLREAAGRLIAQHADASPLDLSIWLYRAALSRRPTDSELDIASQMLGERLTPEGVEDLLWSIIMLPEFQLVR